MRATGSPIFLSLRRSMKKVIFTMLFTASLGAAALSPACKRAGDNANKARTIAVIPKGVTNFFWQSVKAGAEDAGKETGVKIYWKGPSPENDISNQINIVEDAITSRMDAIALAPSHRESLVPVVERAKREGIPVTIFDSGIGTDSY